MTRALPGVLERGVRASGAPLTPEERRSLEGDLAAARELVADTQTRAALARGETQEQALRGLVVEAFRERMTGGSPVLGRLFDAWGPPAAVAAIYRVRGAQEG